MSSIAIFGQLIIGPAGCGKTTYCQVISDYLTKLNRKVIIVNIDPANENLPYNATIDINELISVDDVMNNLDLGPNGALLYSMDYLDANFDWIYEKITHEIESNMPKQDNKDNESTTTKQYPYIIFDCPGQVELYTNYQSFKNILNKLLKGNKQNDKQQNDKDCQSEKQRKNLDLRLVAVNLIDSHYTNDAAKFISVLLTSLTTMLQLELPHVNILSKIDLLQKYGKVHFGIEFYCEVLNLSYLLEQISDDPFFEKYKKLTTAIAGVVEDYSLVSFLPLNINSTKSILNIIKLVDKANGFYLSDINTNEEIERYLKEAQDDSDPNYNEFLNKFY